MSAPQWLTVSDPESVVMALEALLKQDQIAIALGLAVTAALAWKLQAGKTATMRPYSIWWGSPRQSSQEAMPRVLPRLGCAAFRRALQ